MSGENLTVLGIVYAGEEGILILGLTVYVEEYSTC